MGEPFKNQLNEKVVEGISDEISKLFPAFDRNEFKKKVFNSEWEQKELKQRFRHISVTLNDVLGLGYIETLELFKKISGKLGTWAEFILPDYVEVFGLNHFNESMQALEIFTQYSTGEFAVRPFLIKYPDKVMAQMLKWSKHKNHHVRRFSSEGSRPRLPWGLGVPWLKKDPSKIIPILENLKNDKSEYVRKSVANNLNDISKDHPELVLNLSKKWMGKTKEIDWIVKHGCRTLLKKGNKHALALFDISKSIRFKITNFCLELQEIQIGNYTHFSFDIELAEKSARQLRLEYKIYFVNASGGYSEKIFKISEKTVRSGTVINIKRKISFVNLTIRTHFPGKHKLSLVVNGNEADMMEFYLIV